MRPTCTHPLGQSQGLRSTDASPCPCSLVPGQLLARVTRPGGGDAVWAPSRDNGLQLQARGGRGALAPGRRWRRDSAQAQRDGGHLLLKLPEPDHNGSHWTHWEPDLGFRGRAEEREFGVSRRLFITTSFALNMFLP